MAVFNNWLTTFWKFLQSVLMNHEHTLFTSNYFINYCFCLGGVKTQNNDSTFIIRLQR